MQEDLIWTDLSAGDIAQLMSDQSTPVSTYIVEQLLQRFDFHRRQAQKAQVMEICPYRDAQFQTINRLTQEYLDSPNPILSIDTKKRELLGAFFRKGILLTRQTIKVFDHDYPSFADGWVIPHGIFDVKLNRGYIHLGGSHDTSAFACDCLEDWWFRFGQNQYPQATSVLLKCDGGGSNSASTYLFKADLQGLVNKLGLEVRVLHYPPYCSKYNPIEHRLFPHLTRACQGVVFTGVALVKQLMEKARTRTGLSVVVDIVEKVYETGRKVADEVKKTLNLVRDEFLPKLNYRVLPQN